MIVASGDPQSRMGELLVGRYRLRSLIGEGSMGTVYRAFDESTGMVVALKVLHPSYASDDKALARFKREARAAAQLDHDGCVRILDYGAQGATAFIAMELLAGETLYQLLGRLGRLSQARAVTIAAKLCEVLEVAHEHGIVHRDLKPENIMVLPPDSLGQERIKVLDFGIAKLLGPLKDDSQSWDTAARRLTQPGSTLGTPAFMAPEQVRGDPIDDRTDIYVVGILLYEMITGVLPFASDDPVEVMTAQLRLLPEPPSALAPDIDPELERVILTCLEKARAARWPTARILRQALLSVLEALVGHSQPPAQPSAALDDDENYQLTEPVDLRWVRQRRAALLEIGRPEPAVSVAIHTPRATGETRLVGHSEPAGPLGASPLARGTAETRVPSRPAPGALPGGPGSAASSMSSTRPDVPAARGWVGGLSRRTAETRLVEGVPADGAGPRHAGAAPDEDVPTIEVYDEQGRDMEMMIETVVKPLAELDPGLKQKLGMPLGRPGATGGAPGRGPAGAGGQEPLGADESAEETTEDGDTVRRAISPVRQRIHRDESTDDSAISLTTEEVVIVSEHGGPAGQAEPGLVRLVDDDSLDGSVDLGQLPLGPAARGDLGVPPLGADPDDAVDEQLATAIKPDPEAFVGTLIEEREAPTTHAGLGALLGDDALEHMVTMARRDSSEVPGLTAADELATVVRPLSDGDDSELSTAVKPGADGPADDELATTVMSPEEAASDLERAIEARAAAAAAAGPAVDWDDDLKPTAMMPRSQLSEGLPEHVRLALEAELGPIEDTVDDPELPGSVPTPDLLPALVRPRAAPPTQLLEDFGPPPAPGPAAARSAELGLAASQVPPGSGALRPAQQASDEDLDELLRRMPRTRYPVLSTFLAIVVMAAAVAGLLWLIL